MTSLFSFASSMAIPVLQRFFWYLLKRNELTKFCPLNKHFQTWLIWKLPVLNIVILLTCFFFEKKNIRGHSTTTWTEFCHFLRGQFLDHERGQKQTFFDPLPLKKFMLQRLESAALPSGHDPFYLPPSYCPRSYWVPPKCVGNYSKS